MIYCNRKNCYSNEKGVCVREHVGLDEYINLDEEGVCIDYALNPESKYEDDEEEYIRD